MQHPSFRLCSFTQFQLLMDGNYKKSQAGVGYSQTPEECHLCWLYTTKSFSRDVGPKRAPLCNISIAVECANDTTAKEVPYF